MSDNNNRAGRLGFDICICPSCVTAKEGMNHVSFAMAPADGVGPAYLETVTKNEAVYMIVEMLRGMGHDVDIQSDDGQWHGDRAGPKTEGGVH